MSAQSSSATTIGPALVTTGPLAYLHWPAAALADDDAGAGAGAMRPPILLLHGVGGGREAWPDVAPVLAAAGFPVLALDAPGYGDSAALAPCTLVAMAGAIEALIQTLAAGPVIVVGHSMGGMVAQELVHQAPQSVAGLVLVATSPAFGKPGGDWQQDFLNQRFAPLDAGLGMAGLAAQLVPGMAGEQMPAAAMAAAQTLMAAVPEASYRSALKALVSFDKRAALPAIQQPTLVITGELDRTASPEVARRMAERIAGAALVIVPGAGHLLPMQAPQAFNRALLQFLRRHWPDAPVPLTPTSGAA